MRTLIQILSFVLLHFILISAENETKKDSCKFSQYFDTKTLKCLTCHQFSRILFSDLNESTEIIENSKLLIEECFKCCIPTKPSFSHATIEYCPVQISTFPSVQEFISKRLEGIHKDSKLGYAHNLVSKQQRPGITPSLIMKRIEDGSKERYSIDKWSMDQIDDFLFEKLVK